MVEIMKFMVIQGVPGMTYKTYRGDRGGRDEQKIIGERGD